MWCNLCCGLTLIAVVIILLLVLYNYTQVSMAVEDIRQVKEYNRVMYLINADRSRKAKNRYDQEQAALAYYNNRNQTATPTPDSP